MKSNTEDNDSYKRKLTKKEYVIRRIKEIMIIWGKILSISLRALDVLFSLLFNQEMTD